MAAAQRGRKKTQPWRRQRNHSRKPRKSPAKRRRQVSPKPARIGGKNKCSPTHYDTKMLRQLQRSNRQMTSQAKGLLISFMNDMYTKVSSEANRLRKQSRQPTVGSSQMKAALQEVMPTKHARPLVTSFSKKAQ